MDSQTDKAWNIEDYLAVTTNSSGAIIALSGSAGEVYVNAGKLIPDPAANAETGSVFVAGGSTLGGSGSISGSVTVSNSGHVAAGDSAGTLRVGSLSLNGSILDFEGSAATVDAIPVTSDPLTLSSYNTLNL
ncbi:MAG TPA: hypothetical protein VGP99_04160, partial [Tepidisphaeraceae bacterium]|nr:hypothetical protein [Tepidisphaeraceae bacterium]